MNKVSLKDRAKQLQNSLPFMEGREKGETKRILNTNLTIVDYGFMMGEDEKTHTEKEYVCFIVAQDPQNFYFGGQILTEGLKELDADGYAEEIRKDGLPVFLGEKRSKNGRTYTTVTFYPEVSMPFDIVDKAMGKDSTKK